MNFTQIALSVLAQAEQAAEGAAPAAANAVAMQAPAGAFSGGVQQALLGISMQSAATILYLLFAMSILSVAVFIEKYIQYSRDNPLGTAFKGDLVRLLDSRNIAAALKLVDGVRGIKAAIIREGLKNFHEGPFVMAELMDSRTAIERHRLDKRLIILGTVGNNAPFIGLLGTVMGIIKAFHDLSLSTVQGPATVMAGISEALIATAVGLFVAIPAVVFYNYLKAREKALVDDALSSYNVVLAFAKRGQGDGEETNIVGGKILAKESK
jgi:biopolymer transport protein ExbB